MTPRQFRKQDYKKLRKTCEKSHTKFVDTEFTPDTSSIFFDGDKKHDIVWKRPTDMVDHPQLFVDGASVNDVMQGRLGNCWFVAACSALTHNSKLMDKVVPECKSQSCPLMAFNTGIFHFRFWRFGEWLDVVIDDFLPTEDGRLIFAHSSDKNEFWCALLEKAFAKLYGSYEALIGGQLADALVEVSGGVPEHIDIVQARKDEHDQNMIFYNLRDTFDKKALVIAAIKREPGDSVDEALDCGLVKGHAYAVSSVKQIALDNKKSTSLLEMFAGSELIRMIRLHNPWGGVEWKGAWSDDSEQWRQVSDAQKKELGIVVDEDGQFWMTWNDFCVYFTDVTLCHLEHLSFFSMGSTFSEKTIHGQWDTKGKTGKLTDRSGGCANNSSTFLLNPQFMFDVKEDGLEIIMFSLTQKDFVDDKQSTTIEQRKKLPHLYTIGLHIFRVEDNRKYRLHEKPKTTSIVSDYIRTRSVLTKLTNVPRGRYVIMPTTYKPGSHTEFMLRIHAPAGDLGVIELTKDEPRFGICCCMKSAACVTRLSISKATNLETKSGSRRIDPYLWIIVEGKKTKSQHCVDTANPEWNVEYIFHRRKPSQPIVVELWDANYVKDALLGRATLEALVDNETRTMEVGLKDRSGKIFCTIATFDDAKYF